jgi:phosphopentomutase
VGVIVLWKQQCVISGLYISNDLGQIEIINVNLSYCKFNVYVVQLYKHNVLFLVDFIHNIC